jgi:hypothetical protein
MEKIIIITILHNLNTAKADNLSKSRLPFKKRINGLSFRAKNLKERRK